jgi:hypothetical protein
MTREYSSLCVPGVSWPVLSALFPLHARFAIIVLKKGSEQKFKRELADSFARGVPVVNNQCGQGSCRPAELPVRP